MNITFITILFEKAMAFLEYYIREQILNVKVLSLSFGTNILYISRGKWRVLEHGSLHLRSLHFAMDMSGQVLRVKGYYDVMIHKHHCEDVYDLIDLWHFFISIFED